ncbi:MAG: methyltransferase domain-containing protein [Candidatus Coatesbacteria bacterium]|nr:methyltransferase domain-containing protein [Candidatus Coatesbacteria bacterium]
MGTWEEVDWCQHYMKSWYAYPGMERRLYSALTQSQDISNHQQFLCWLVHRFTASSGRKLRLIELGCGPTPSSNHLLRECGIHIASAVCIDVSRELIDRASAASESECATFRVLDMETISRDDFNGEQFDLCIAAHSIHHVLNLEPLFASIRQLLSADGLLWMNEYTGPRRMQFPEEALALGNRFLATLPDSFRARLEGTSKDMLAPAVQDDPTEAVASDLILPIFLRNFEPLRFLPYGTLSYMVFDEIAHNFRGQEAELLGQYVWEYEQRCFLDGTLRPWFTACIARPWRNSEI